MDALSASTMAVRRREPRQPYEAQYYRLGLAGAGQRIAQIDSAWHVASATQACLVRFMRQPASVGRVRWRAHSSDRGRGMAPVDTDAGLTGEAILVPGIPLKQQRQRR